MQQRLLPARPHARHRRWLAVAARTAHGRVSFEEGHALLGELAGVDVSTKQVEREAERLGREIAEVKGG